MIGVCNTSPLILLSKANRLDLLLQLYDATLLPASVMNEVAVKSGKEVNQIQALASDRRCHVVEADHSALLGLPPELGDGEREVIAVALEGKAGLVILDDQLSRKVARSKGLSVTGTIGVLIEGKARGLLAGLRPELDRLMEAGMWMSEAFYERILREFGE